MHQTLGFARQAHAKSPGDSRALLLLALLERRTGDFDGAIRDMRARKFLDAP